MKAGHLPRRPDTTANLLTITLETLAASVRSSRRSSDDQPTIPHWRRQRRVRIRLTRYGQRWQAETANRT